MPSGAISRRALGASSMLVERDAHERARRVGGRGGGDVEQRGRRGGGAWGWGMGSFRRRVE